MAKKRPVLVMAGGTGGHVFPALAVARELMRRGVPVVWLGTKKGMEAKIIPQEGIRIEWLSVAGLRGKKISKLVIAPFMLSWSALQALWVVFRLRPRAVLGMGGFVTGPGGIAARVLLKPLCIHEQNAIAGLTNRVLSKFANVICSAFPDVFAKSKKYIVTGNPVRADIVGLADPETRFATHNGPLRLLVIGGSLGAQAINLALPKALAMMAEDERPVVRHQAGAKNIEQAREYYQQQGLDIEPTAFIEDMAEAYGWADLVLCRAGALTISELAAAGVGSLLVPYPYAVDDHQTANAKFLTAVDAAQLIPEKELVPEKLKELLATFSRQRHQCLQMAIAARTLAIKDSAIKVADICLSMSEKKPR